MTYRTYIVDLDATSQTDQARRLTVTRHPLKPGLYRVNLDEMRNGVHRYVELYVEDNESPATQLPWARLVEASAILDASFATS